MGVLISGEEGSIRSKQIIEGEVVEILSNFGGGDAYRGPESKLLLMRKISNYMIIFAKYIRHIKTWKKLQL